MLICDKKTQEAKTTKTSKREILTFAQHDNVPAIKLEDCDTTMATEQPPIKLVMKIPKKFNTDATGAAPLVEKTTEIIKPIKLKIKTQDMVTIASSVKVENDGDDDVPDAEDESDSESEIRNEDDVLMNELKNSYQDNDFGRFKYK